MLNNLVQYKDFKLLFLIMIYNNKSKISSIQRKFYYNFSKYVAFQGYKLSNI